MTLLEQNALRDYADRAKKICIDPPYFTSADIQAWAKRERRRRARNWWLLTVACVVVAVIVGYFL